MKLTNVEKLVVPEVSGKYGAPMGRRDFQEDNPGKLGKLRAHRIRFIDGDYDRGGAYWGGGGLPMWAVWAKSSEYQIALCVYVRAASKSEAISIAKTKLKD